MSWERVLWREIYTMPDRSLLKVKQDIENHLWVEEASVLGHKPP